MPTRTRILDLAVVATAALLIASPAYAYIDPGTGSVVTTAILGFFAAVAYTFRKYMYRIKDMFTGGSKSNTTDRKSGMPDER